MPCCEAALVGAFYAARDDEGRRETFLAQLPFLYGNGASHALQEFLAAHVTELAEWSAAFSAKPFMYRAVLCVAEIRRSADGINAHLLSMQTVATATAV